MATTTEKYTTLAETTLAAVYLPASGVLAVTSAIGFPSSPNFHVRLNNPSRTVLLVSAIAGVNWTVSVEVNDGIAQINTGVTLVLSAASLDAIRVDLEQLSTLAARNAAEKAGIIQRFTDAPYVARDNGAGFGYWGPLYWLVPLDTSTWVWVNQGAATVTASLLTTLLTVPSTAGTNVRLLKKAAPATPWTVTAAITPRLRSAASSSTGIAMRESATGRIIAIYFLANATSVPRIPINKYNSPTSFNSTPADSGQFASYQGPLWWLRMSDNGVNITFSYSFDGVHFVQLFSEPRATFFTTGPDEVGIHGDNNGGVDGNATFFSWMEA